jgi:Dolichyl-phosphate-mannose-protein mannosyltransferase
MSRAAGGLLLVLAVAAALRFTGIAWLLPGLVEQDAHIPIQVRLMEGAGAADGEARVDWGVYPHLVARLTHWLTPRDKWTEPAVDADLAAHLARARWPVLRVRLVVALLSLLAVPATWLLARLWLPAAWSLLAAACMATSLLATHFAAQARAHGAAVGLFALAVLACVRLRQRGDARSYLLAGLAVGLVLGCLQSGVAALIPLLVAHVGVARERRRHRLLLVPLLCLLAAVPAFYPFLLESGAERAGRLEVDAGVLEVSKHHIFLGMFNGAGFPLMARALRDWEPALAAGVLLAGALWIAARRRPSALVAPPGARLVVLSFVLPYALVVGLYQRSYERFLLPLVPFLAVFAAWGAARACELIRRPAARRVAAAALVALLVGLPAVVGVQLMRARLAPSTLDLAAEWLEEHAGGEAVVISRSLSPPVFRTSSSLALDAPVRPDRGLGWLSYQRHALAAQPPPAYDLLWMPFTTVESLRQDLARGPRRWVAALPADLCLNEVVTEPQTSAELTVITAALRDSAEPLARLSPDGELSAYEVKLAYQDESAGDVPPMAWRVLRARGCGPVIEVFRIAHEAGGGR